MWPAVIKFLAPLLPMVGKVVLVAASAYAIFQLGHDAGRGETLLEVSEERRIAQRDQSQADAEQMRLDREADLKLIANHIARNIQLPKASEIRHETIREIITPEKDAFCRPDDRIVRLLERARSGAAELPPGPSEPSAGNRATPESFSYADFIASYEELATRFVLLRARNNDLVNWNLNHDQTYSNPKGIRNSLE